MMIVFVPGCSEKDDDDDELNSEVRRLQQETQISMSTVQSDADCPLCVR